MRLRALNGEKQSKMRLRALNGEKSNQKWDWELSILSVFGWAMLFSYPVLGIMLVWQSSFGIFLENASCHSRFRFKQQTAQDPNKKNNTKVMATSTSLMRLIILGDEHTFAFAEKTRFTADAFVSTIKTDSSYTKYISIFIFLFLRNKENQRQKLYVM